MAQNESNLSQNIKNELPIVNMEMCFDEFIFTESMLSLFIKNSLGTLKKDIETAYVDGVNNIHVIYSDGSVLCTHITEFKERYIMAIRDLEQFGKFLNI